MRAPPCAGSSTRRRSSPAPRTERCSTSRPSFYDFVALTAAALGTGPPRRVPAWLARIAAGADPVRAVVRSARSSNAWIKAELGWQPRWPTAELGVPDAVAALARR